MAARRHQPLRFFVVVLAAVVASSLYFFRTAPIQASADDYLFCFWNVENLFDDINDNHRPVDEKYDDPFAKDPQLLKTKLANLSKILLQMNNGRGPDILALAEVESDRAVELLRDQLNRDLGNRAQPYQHILFKKNTSGRHIATAMLTRLPVRGNRTQKLDNVRRILEGHIEVAGKQLVIVASHWTSRVSDDDGRSRAKYGDVLYGRFNEMYRANAAIDFLVCGDFNDEPDDDSVTKHLRATGDRNALTIRRDPMLFNLMANKDKRLLGTHEYDSKWFLFDQIAVSPGLMDNKGWTALPETVRVERQGMERERRGFPWRFNEDSKGRRIADKKYNGRGFADHFPVTVRLNLKK